MCKRRTTRIRPIDRRSMNPPRFIQTLFCRLRRGFLLALLLALVQNPGHAQQAARASLYSLQTNAFPVMSTGLDVFTASGVFVTGLQGSAVTLLEDDQPRTLTRLEETQPGVDFALALDPGPYFAYRDTRAVTKMDKIVQAVNDWLTSHAESYGDDLSLILNPGSPKNHLKRNIDLANALTAWNPDLNASASTPATLAQALNAVSETDSSTGRKRLVLYVTSLPVEASFADLQNLARQAVLQKVRVCVWMVAPLVEASTTGATALKDLALQTGGRYVQFSGVEALPNIEDYLVPLRHTYTLEYPSGIITSGQHSLKVKVNLSGQELAAETLFFDLTVLPPKAVLLAPPREITRSIPTGQDSALSSYLPGEQQIQILLQFPDGHKRPLLRTTLLVDGAAVAENFVEPFELFTWDVSAYGTSARHVLSVEVVDTLGLSSVSYGFPVQVNVVKPQAGWWSWLDQYRLQAAAGGGLLAAGLLSLLLVLRRRRKHKAAAARRSAGRKAETQPVEALPAPRRSMKFSPASLQPLMEDNQPAPAPAIPIPVPRMTLGSDPRQCSTVLNDTSISPLHARIEVVPLPEPPGGRRAINRKSAEEKFEYLLVDENSTAGTWVNYESVTSARVLHHGDILHLGRASFRFIVRNAPEPAPLKITRLEPGSKNESSFP